MRFSPLLVTSFAMLMAFQSFAAEPAQDNQVELTVVRYSDHVQLQCNPVSLATAMRSDWKLACNQKAFAEVGKLIAAGAVAAVQGPIFNVSAPATPAGPMLLRNIPLQTAHH